MASLVRLTDAARLIFAPRDPADRETEQGRSRARHRAIALTALSSAFAKAVSVTTTLVSVPLTLHYLGPERYGMWMTLSAFSLLMSFTDFGIGNGVLTAVAQGEGRQDAEDLRRQVSSAYGAMAIIAALMLAVLGMVHAIVPWARLFNVSTPLAAAEAGPAAAVFFSILAVTSLFTLVQRIQMGLQEGFLSNVWQSAANIAALLALVVATRSGASLPWLVAALMGTPLLVSAVNSIDFFVRRRPDLMPKAASLDWGTMRQVSKSGSLFLVLQICAAVMFQTNAIIIAQVIDAKAVAQFAVPDRLFSLVGVLLTLVLMPLWPAYGDAAARGDIQWIRRTLLRSLVVAVGGTTLLALLFVLAGQTLIGWWVGSAVSAPFALLAGLGVWKVIESAGNAVAMFLNGVNALAVQASCAIFTAAASVALKTWLTARIGIAGVPLGMILAYSTFTLPFLGFSIRRALARIGSTTQVSKV